MGTIKRNSILDDRVIGAGPYKKPESDPVERGLEAWERRKENAKASFGDWLVIGDAFMVGREQAMAAARTNAPRGKKYRDHFGFFLDKTGFRDIDERTRGCLFRIMERRAEVEEYYYERLTPAQRTRWNNPYTVWDAFDCTGKRGFRGGKPKAPGHSVEPPVATAQTALERTADEVEEEQEEIAWQRSLLLRSRKAVGEALIGRWVLPDLPDAGLIEDVRKARDAWSATFRYLEILHTCVKVEELRKFQEAKGNSVELLQEAEEYARILRTRLARAAAGPRERTEPAEVA